MKLERALYQRSHVYFIIFFLFVVVAFWFSYFVKIFDQENYRLHLHGFVLILWCLMLIGQPYLISIRKFSWHKRVGTFSYILVPLLVFTTVDLLRYKLSTRDVFGTSDYFFIALVVNALIAFLVLYGLAIFHRKRPAIHARYMVCTVFPLFTPVTDRIIYTHFPSSLQYLPTIEGRPIAPTVGFLIADLLLLGLIVWDWRSHNRWNVFPVALLVLILYHYSVLKFYQFQFWQDLSSWMF
jgi:hypothetical protein